MSQSESKPIRFNCNDYVRVQLTDRGRELFRANWVNFWAGMPGSVKVIPFEPAKEDADGWSEWQLWELMREFGPHFSMGCQVPFLMNIELIPGTASLGPEPEQKGQ